MSKEDEGQQTKGGVQGKPETGANHLEYERAVVNSD